MSKNSTGLPLFEKINSYYKLFICLAIALLVYFFIGIKDINELTHFMIGWNTFSLCMIIMSWITFSITNAQQIRAQSKIQDPSRPVIFIIILIATLVGFLTVLLLILSKKSGTNDYALQTIVAIAGMLLSWFLIHTTFTLRYAHIYYSDHKTKINTHAGGLEFPNDDKPEYFDFAYFSFVLGMTFQVSDVEISSKRLRKLALLHGLLSFIFNTIMIALTINLIAQ